jgi:hypothetical protein
MRLEMRSFTNLFHKRLKKLTLLSTAGYLFMFILVAKGVFLYANRHPSKERLLSVEGVVRHVRLGGQGKATWFKIESDSGTHRYSSYYGRVWPEMEGIHSGDWVRVLAERNRLNRNELIKGKQYYIWELVHRNRVIVSYEDVYRLVRDKEAAANRLVNGFLLAGAVFLFTAYVRRVFLSKRRLSS